MKATIKKLLASALMVPMIAFGVSAVVAPAATFADPVSSGINATNVGQSQPASLNTIIKNIVNILLYAIGVLSVIMLIVGGIRYATSAGNSSQVTAAKNTIMYALIGLVVAILAIAIVNFVIGGVTTGSSS